MSESEDCHVDSVIPITLGSDLHIRVHRVRESIGIGGNSYTLGHGSLLVSEVGFLETDIQRARGAFALHLEKESGSHPGHHIGSTETPQEGSLSAEPGSQKF